MKKIFTLVLLLIGISTFAQNKHSVTQSQARLIESQYGVLTAPIIGELDQISSKKIIHKVEFFIGGFKDAQRDIVPNLEDYKKYTIANYCTENDYDLLINPLFQVVTNAEGDKLIVTVTGYPARYKSFRPAKEEDRWMTLFIKDNSTDDRIKKTMDNNR
ncbi:MAG: hypothetical protein H6Q16_928 [Bacteroidetes bacterium]|nr:hypothetical protein [Bacteroidota bacterium]